MLRISRLAGFTLLELAIVTTIIAVIVAGTVSMSGSMVDSANHANSNNKLNEIEAALMAYRYANNRLPCPADPTMLPANAGYGYEAGAAGSCAAANIYTANNGNNANIPAGTTVAEGALPLKTIGLPTEFMYDAWGYKFGYAVWTPMTGTNAFLTYGATQDLGGITVENAGYGNRSSTAVYVIISYGPDRHGGYTSAGTRYNAASDNADEITNAHYSSGGVNQTYVATYVEHDWTQSAADPKNIYDDQVRFRERWQLQNTFDTYTPNDCPSGCVWVADNTNNNVQQFYNGANPSSIGTYLNQFGGTGGAQFTNPSGIAIDTSGNIWVADSGNNRIEEFYSNGTFRQAFGSAGVGSGNFSNPTGIAIDLGGNVWVTDKGNNRVIQLSNTGSPMLTVPSGCAGAVPPACPAYPAVGSQFNAPSGIAIDGSGNVWVSDLGGGITLPRVQEFSSTGGVQATVLSPFNNPAGVTVDGDGNIWVVDSGGKDVVEFSNTGVATGTTISGFSNPTGIAIDKSNNIWVVDSGNYYVQEFNTSATYLNQIGNGAPGAGNGQFNDPYGIAIH